MDAVIRYPSKNNSCEILMIHVFFCDHVYLICMACCLLLVTCPYLLICAVTEFSYHNCYIPTVMYSSERIKQRYLFKFLKHQGGEQESPKNIYQHNSFSVTNWNVSS
jgi:hypothetical protein